MSILNLFRQTVDENQFLRAQYGPNWKDILKAIRTGDEVTLDNISNVGVDSRGTWYEKWGFRYYIGQGFACGCKYVKNEYQQKVRLLEDDEIPNTFEIDDVRKIYYVFISADSIHRDSEGSIVDRYGRPGFLVDFFKRLAERRENDKKKPEEIRSGGNGGSGRGGSGGGGWGSFGDGNQGYGGAGAPVDF